MATIRELYDEHRKLEALAGQMLAIVAGRVADAAAIAGIRWRMAQALLDHCAAEDRSVYDRLLASGDAAATALAWRYRQEFGALGAAFAHYISDWPVDRINRNWIGFRADTETMMGRILARIECEESELYAHAERIAARRRAA
ncbi:hemerythrin domain-containing protein [Sphingomonas sp. LB-2]|uniref:hemerythrin domain-containing protein n=1 Tax=Sphingomonas caeni TaxID=2984949 RepID=UPI002230ADA1|nr:hemerythrin domain-containing protein [Sphingomonas caeni]MCW3846156.1 hemerythrin domain-containing protein [Sphingomonas caeni]